jgi:hypothetical protein
MKTEKNQGFFEFPKSGILAKIMSLMVIMIMLSGNVFAQITEERVQEIENDLSNLVNNFEELLVRIDDLEIKIETNEDNIGEMQIQISDLQLEDESFQEDLTSLSDEVSTISAGECPECAGLQTQINQLSSDLNNNVVILETEATNLRNEVEDLSVISEMIEDSVNFNKNDADTKFTDIFNRLGLIEIDVANLNPLLLIDFDSILLRLNELEASILDLSLLTTDDINDILSRLGLLETQVNNIGAVTETDLNILSSRIDNNQNDILAVNLRVDGVRNDLSTHLSQNQVDLSSIVTRLEIIEAGGELKGCQYNNPSCEAGFSCVVNACVSNIDLSFVTTVPNDYSNKNGELAVDRNMDGTKECYEYYSYFRFYVRPNPKIVGHTPEGYEIHEYSNDRLIIRNGNNPIYKKTATCSLV